MAHTSSEWWTRTTVLDVSCPELHAAADLGKDEGWWGSSAWGRFSQHQKCSGIM